MYVEDYEISARITDIKLFKPGVQNKNTTLM